jgi:iron complex outermembrane receptor protein
LFRRWDSNLIGYVQFAPGGLFHATNIDTLHFTGVEAHGAFLLPRGQQIQLAYTFLHGDQMPVPGSVSRYVFNYPSHHAVFGWTGTWHDRIVARTRVGVTQRFARQAYPVWDLAVSRKNRIVRPYLQLANLSNTGYEEIPGVLMPSHRIVGGMEIVLTRQSR